MRGKEKTNMSQNQVKSNHRFYEKAKNNMKRVEHQATAVTTAATPVMTTYPSLVNSNIIACLSHQPPTCSLPTQTFRTTSSPVATPTLTNASEEKRKTLPKYRQVANCPIRTMMIRN